LAATERWVATISRGNLKSAGQNADDSGMKIKLTQSELFTARIAGIAVSPDFEIEATAENAQKARTASEVFGDNDLGIAVSSATRLAERITEAMKEAA